MGKKPFSAKAKREQLRQKRLAAATGNNTSVSRSNSKQVSTASTSGSQSSAPPPTSSPPTPAPQRHARGRAPRGAHSHRYRLQLSDGDAASSAAARAAADAAHTPIVPVDVVETSVDEIRPYPDERFSMPRRPAWRYDETVEVVDRRETAALRAWRERVVASSDAPPFFEHNLETWRQLWRVIERSDVFVLVVDIRFPALHFVPDLYYYVADDLGKDVVLALNKCDLVPMDVLQAWKRFFEDTYPRLAVAMFSSFPDAKLAPSEHNSEMLSKREQRMARSKLSAWGADQLLTALNTLRLDAKKREYLEAWRLEMTGESSDDDDDLVHRSAKAMAYSGATVTPGATKLKAEVGGSVPAAVQKKKSMKKRRRQNQVDENVDEADKEGKSAYDETVEIGGENMVTIGIVGHPNAGKSSLINGIFRKKVVSTSSTPGHTKHLQTIFVSESVQLCDCPGLVFPGLAPRELQILAGMFPVAQLREPLAVVRYLAERVDIVKILKLDVEVSKLENFLLESDYVKDGWTAWKICEAWAMKRGYRTAKAARLDVPRAANHILRLAVEGRIVLSTVPPGFKGGAESADSSVLLGADWSDGALDGGDDVTEDSDERESVPSLNAFALLGGDD